jgi:hypothetical protein
VAHFLEHLLFKGTTTVGTRDLEAERALFTRMDAAHDSLVLARGAWPDPDTARVRELEARITLLEDSARVHVVSNEFDEILSRNGARGLNATTSYEATEYFVELPANRAKLWFVLEADRMRNPVFREFYREREVIEEERRARMDSDPGGLLYEAHLGAAFRVHPYGVAPIGHMDDIRNLTRRDVEDFYRSHYGPENTVVAVVGAIDPDSIGGLGRRLLLPPGAPGRGAPRSWPGAAPAGGAPHRGHPRRRAPAPHRLEGGERGPPRRPGPGPPGQPPGGGAGLPSLPPPGAGGSTGHLRHRRDGSRKPVPRRLHHPGRAPGPPHPRGGGGGHLPGAGAAPARAPHRPGAGAGPARLEAARVRRLTSNLGLAFQLAGSTAFHGDWRTTFELQERMQAVEAQDVVRVLERYFHREGRTVGILRRFGGHAVSGLGTGGLVLALVPPGPRSPRPWPRRPGFRRGFRKPGCRSFRSRKPTPSAPSPPWGGSAVEALTFPPVDFAPPRAREHEILGVPVYHLHDPTLPLVDVFVQLRGGISHFPREDGPALTALSSLVRNGGTPPSPPTRWTPASTSWPSSSPWDPGEEGPSPP